jgi:hypothetical protein
MFNLYLDGAEFIMTYPHYTLEFASDQEVSDFCKKELPLLNKTLIQLSDLVRRYIIREELPEQEKQLIFGTRK